ncbi:MAG: hypothetical protein NTW84_05940 [Methanothrix sp.]|nr:hypothetical protein [Methanothrix sp.]
MKWLLALLLVFVLCIIIPTATAANNIDTGVNLTEHSWIYNQGYMDAMRIYQNANGYNGQKLVTGTRGTGTVSRSIHADVYGGYGTGTNEMYFNEFGIFQNKPAYTPPLTQSDLRNALCAKNYDVGSVYSESYSNIRDLIKDTTFMADNYVSVYDIHSEVQGTAKIGARVQRSSSSIGAYVMGGTYMGQTNMRFELETGNASVMTLPCP